MAGTWPAIAGWRFVSLLGLQRFDKIERLVKLRKIPIAYEKRHRMGHGVYIAPLDDII